MILKDKVKKAFSLAASKMYLLYDERNRSEFTSLVN